MKKDLNILFLDIKSHFIAYLFPILMIYCAFVPYVKMQLQYMSEPFERELTYFSLSQQFLNVFIVYCLWLIMKNYLDGSMVEVLASMDHKYKIRYLLYAIIGYLIILIPYFIITYIELGHVFYSIFGLIFEFIILACVFYGFLMLLRNSLVILGFLIIFIMLFTQFFKMEEFYILFHVTMLAQTLPMQYWIFHSLIGIVMLGIGLYIEIHRLYIK